MVEEDSDDIHLKSNAYTSDKVSTNQIKLGVEQRLEKCDVDLTRMLAKIDLLSDNMNLLLADQE